MELNIFLNDVCSLNCLHCDRYFKQMNCCTTHVNKELSVEDIEDIFRQIQYSTVGKVNILGDNIFEYQHIDGKNGALPARKTVQMQPLFLS